MNDEEKKEGVEQEGGDVELRDETIYTNPITSHNPKVERHLEEYRQRRWKESGGEGPCPPDEVP